MCRANIKHKKTVPHPTVQGLVSVLSADEELQERQKNYLKWKNSLKLDINLKRGELIDVRDIHYVWVVGRVLDIIKCKNGLPRVLLISFRGMRSCYNEYIGFNSSRLAPYRSFTTRNEMPSHLRITLEAEAEFLFQRFQ